MSITYFKFRNIKIETNEKIGEDFWKSFIFYIKRLAKEYYFFNEFRLNKELDYGKCIDLGKIEQKIALELGIEIDLIANKNTPETSDILSIIELLYRYISKPEEYIINNQGIPYPISFNPSAARFEYAIKINNMFSDFNKPYRLFKGALFLKK